MKWVWRFKENNWQSARWNQMQGDYKIDTSYVEDRCM